MSFRTLSEWLLSELRLPQGMQARPEALHTWWRVMCLTGVDYFSTLGYQPGIAFLAAGFLSPLATLVLVLVTLLAALPVYRKVAEVSSSGQGSIAMLEHLLPRWGGKTLVLVLLGFATTDFVITMTLSAADGAAHIVHNPLAPSWMHHQERMTLLILSVLAVIFLKGFREAIDVAVVLVGAYLSLNAIVTSVAIWEIVRHPALVLHWSNALVIEYPNPLTMAVVCLILFPKLALGLSGFETGVAVMPLIDCQGLPARIRNAHKLLTTAAVIMSIFLLATSLTSTLLIEPEKFREGGEANGRAMAYLAHKYLGNGFGTVYDISTILILGFAGASAMAGLLNLIPRYLPQYGMAPEWARASRPLVLVFTGIAFTVTLLFRADVDAQGGAYATGVLVLITSAAFAVTLSAWSTRRKWPFLFITLVFVYTMLQNMRERPDGVKISAVFVTAMVLTSLTSRALRSTELRITDVHLDESARELIAGDRDQQIRLVARKPRIETVAQLDQKDREIRYKHNLAPDEEVYFFEVERGDASEFRDTLRVTGERVGRHCILKARSAAVANAIAATLICLEQTTGRVPHAYFEWNEGHPIGNLFRFIFLGEGDTAPLVHEVLRRAIPDPKKRPVIHVS